MKSYTTNNRLLQITIPSLEGATLLPISLQGTENLQQPFNYQLNIVSPCVIKLDQLFAQSATVTLSNNSTPQLFNGLITECAQGNKTSYNWYSYRLTLQPWLSLLAHSSHNRIFQNKTIVEIIEQVFAEHGFTDYSTKLLINSYRPLKYCVQYDETDLNFIYRLMQSAGMYNSFSHEANKHTLALLDSGLAQQQIPGTLLCTEQATDPHFHDWTHCYSWGPQCASGRMYSYETPDRLIEASSHNPINYPHIQHFNEAQWEYVARDLGKDIPYPTQNGKLELDKNYPARQLFEDYDYYGLKGRLVIPVTQIPINQLGIHQMGGNVTEWVHDWYSQDYYWHSTTNNPQGPATNNGDMGFGAPLKATRGFSGVEASSLASYHDKDSKTQLQSGAANYSRAGMPITQKLIGFRCVINSDKPLTELKALANKKLAHITSQHLPTP